LESKTTIVSNFAVTFAQSGNRVLLVDADLRKPSVGSSNRYCGKYRYGMKN